MNTSQLKGGVLLNTKMKIASLEGFGSKQFLHIEMIVLNDKNNRNNVCVSKQWIYQFVENQKYYTGIPLMCDINSLLNNEPLTHLLDRTTGTFGTQQIGSFISFDFIEEDNICSLIGTVRISKRYKNVVEKLLEIQKIEGLKFSYEIDAKEVVEIGDISYVTESPSNELIGVAVVSVPAIPESKALLVAEKDETDEIDNLNEGDENALDEKEKKDVLDEVEVSEKQTEEMTEDTDKKEPPVSEANTEATDPKEEDEKDAEELVASKKDKEDEKASSGCKTAEEDSSEDAQILELQKQIELLTEQLSSYQEKEAAEMRKQKELKVAQKIAFIEEMDIVLSEEQERYMASAKEELDEAKMNNLIAELVISKNKKETTAKDSKQTVTAEFEMKDLDTNSLFDKYLRR